MEGIMIKNTNNCKNFKFKNNTIIKVSNIEINPFFYEKLIKAFDFQK